MNSHTQQRNLSLLMTPLAASLVIALGGLASPVNAQSIISGANNEDVGPAGATVKREANDNKSPLNGYAERLKPKVKRPAVLQNQPYQPIKKQDDQAQIPEIEMFVGESRVFPTPGVARIAVGNGQILTAAALDNKEVILFANAVGTSSLFVWNDDGRYQRVKINIVPGDTSRFAREIAAFLSAIPNTKASVIGDKVIVEGDNLSDQDIAKIDELAKRYPQIVNFTDRLGLAPMVMMDVKVVEFPVDELRELGLKWSATGGAAIGGIWSPFRRNEPALGRAEANVGPLQINIQTGMNNPLPIVGAQGASSGIPLPSSATVLTGVNLGLNAQLSMLAQNGKAVLLAEPQLAARSGAKASFLAGGEFPYSVSNINGVTVVFKQYGIRLEIQPKVDRNGNIRAKIDAEISKLDLSVSAAGGPALLTRRTDTEFNVRSGETMVLSGLIQVDTSTNVDKIPMLGDIPVLGALFRSKRFQNKETELVVFVTPIVVDSRTPALVDRVERTHGRLQEYLDRQPPYLTNPLQPEKDSARINQISPGKQSATVAEAESLDAPATSLNAASKVAIASASSRPAEHMAVVPDTHNPFRPAARSKDLSLGGSALRVRIEKTELRARPSASSAALLQLVRGARVQMTGQTAHDGSGMAWRRVVVGEIAGWIAGKAVEPAKLEPGLYPDSTDAVTRIDQQGAVVGLGNARARIPSGQQHLVTASPPSSAAQDAGPLKRYRVLLNDLALRVAPDINAHVVDQLAKGAIVDALQLPPKGYWSAVQIGDKRGWVATQWLAAEQ